MKYKSSICESVHQAAQDLQQSGLIDVKTMREFDAMCIKPAEPLSKSAIKKIRLGTKLSQPVFAACLNVSPSAVKQWEIGEKRPGGAALKLLHLVQDHGIDILF